MSNSLPLTPDVPNGVTPDETVDERRHLRRLRELCDEVLASQRVAEGRDVMTDDERREARELLQAFAPRVGQRERGR